MAGVLSSNECNYIAPLYYPDKITVNTKVTGLSKEMLVMDYFTYRSNV